MAKRTPQLIHLCSAELDPTPTTMDSTEYTSVMDEIQALKKNASELKISIQSATSSFLTFTYERTPSTKVKATLTFPDDYPSHSLLVNIMWLPPGLQKKLQTMLDKVAADLAPHYSQMEAVVQRLVTFMDTNLFVPCWKELRKVVDLIQHDEHSTIAMNDAKGLIKLRLASGKYFYSCSITIDPLYPTTTPQNWGNACKLKMRDTNFPPKIESLLTLQAKELVRRMQDGMPAERALLMSNPIAAPDNMEETNEQPTVSISKDTLKGLHHDVETMARVRDLRQVNAETKRGDARVKAFSTKERKEARRTIGKLTKQELAQDREWEKQEQARLEGYNIPDYADSEPQPSLLSLVTFLETKIQRLPEEKCPICKELTLPSDPNELKGLYDLQNASDKKARKQAKRQRPVRTYCGCWYHYACLDKFMTEPPFGASCPTADCGRRVYHPEWPADIRELERGWAMKQARQREIEDAAMCF